MTPAETVRLVAMRDFTERVQSRAFQISTAFTLLLVLGAAIIPSLFRDDTAPPLEIGAVGEVSPLLATQVAVALDGDRSVEVVAFGSVTAAEAALDDGEIGLVVVAGAEVIVGDGPSATASIVGAVAAALDVADRAAELGLTAADVAALIGEGAYPIRSLEPETDEQQANRAFAFVGSILLFISIVTYGQWILIGVIEEKTNRVVEVVLGAVRPHLLLAGKVAGIGLLGLGQLLGTAAIGLTAITIAGTFTLPSATVSVVGNVVFWFVLGYAFYATAYAAAGALVSRQEEAQNVAFPLTIVLTAAYFIAAASIGGDNPVLRVTSLLPPFAPMTMPLRIAGGDASTVEIGVSILLMVGAVYVLIRIAGRVYSGGLLRTGGKVRIRDAWRSAEA